MIKRRFGKIVCGIYSLYDAVQDQVYNSDPSPKKKKNQSGPRLVKKVLLRQLCNVLVTLKSKDDSLTHLLSEKVTY